MSDEASGVLQSETVLSIGQPITLLEFLNREPNLDKRVFYFFRKRLGDQVDPENLAADVFLRLTKYKEELRPPRLWHGLVWRIAANLVCDVSERTAKVHFVALPSDDELDSGERPGNTLEDQEVLTWATSQLSEMDQRIIIMKYLEQRLLNEIAEILGIAVSTVSERGTESLRTLKRLLVGLYG